MPRETECPGRPSAWVDRVPRNSSALETQSSKALSLSRHSLFPGSQSPWALNLPGDSVSLGTQFPLEHNIIEFNPWDLNLQALGSWSTQSPGHSFSRYSVATLRKKIRGGVSN